MRLIGVRVNSAKLLTPEAFEEVNELLRRTNSTPVELLKWAEKTIESDLNHSPRSSFSFKDRYIFLNKGICSFWKKFYEDKEFRDITTGKYREHYNLE